eukprot:gene10783-11937_t
MQLVSKKKSLEIKGYKPNVNVKQRQNDYQKYFFNLVSNFQVIRSDVRIEEKTMLLPKKILQPCVQWPTWKEKKRRAGRRIHLKKIATTQGRHKDSQGDWVPIIPRTCIPYLGEPGEREVENLSINHQ